MKVNFLTPVLLSAVFCLACCGTQTVKNEPQQSSEMAFVDRGKTSIGSAGVREEAPKEELPQEKSGPMAFDRYDISFWDSLKVRRHHRPENPDMKMAGSQDFKNLRQNISAYKFGVAFAREDEDKNLWVKRLLPKLYETFTEENDTLSTEMLFSQCVMETEQNQQAGTAAIMVSGYFFEQLSQILGDVNDLTHLPDENVLSEGIAKLDSLKSYCNNALLSEPDINITLPIQRIIAATDSIKAAYKDCQTLGGDNKYEKLYEKLSESESKIFEDRK
ncbi:MAG: hypothetical protein IIU03_01465 [Bacteroidales bacterium]|nr:hypothetical protein [Bacteroidales bacterium]MBQ5538887.1 hypothetical protein [Bacteroidales bacterium]MBR4677047.1 hypothetical protein [Bacteroidales bacterium]